MNAKIATSVALVAAVLGGASSAPTAQLPTFRAATDVVEVDVVVEDRQGHFVTDLSPADFEVSEEGAPQRVSLFYLVESGVARAPALPVQNESAAATGAAPRTPRFFIVYFDDAHLTPAGFKRVQAAALTLFSREFKPGDVGGVIYNGAMANGRLTSDREELVKAIKNAKPNSAKNSRLMEERSFPRMGEIEAVRIRVNNDENIRAEVIRRAIEEEPNTRVEIIEAMVDVKTQNLSSTAQAESNQTLQGLLAVMNGLARIEGRKTILLLSEGFIAEESWPLVRTAVDSASRANARLYTLDARGLERGLRSIYDVAPGGSDSGLRTLEQQDVGADAINSLAVDTGGFVVRNTNIFDAAVGRIAADAGTYYVLGYRPDKAADGKYRRLSVKVTRPGLVVRARKGYVATPRAAAAPAVTATGTPAAPRSQPVPAPTPDDVREPSPVEPPTAPAGGGDATLVPATSAGNGVRLRPNVEVHLNDLAANEGPDKDATTGWEAYQRGDLATARTFLATAAARRTAQLWVHYALGQSEYALREYPGAVAAWERVHGGAPEFEPVYFDLVDGYLQLKEYDKAVRLLRTATERWPRDPEVFNALGVVQTARGSLDDAVKSFGQAIAAVPGDAIGYFNLGKAMELRYYRSRHYVQQLRTWVANESDRAAAVEHYEHYLTLGGPYADAAREGLTRLNWTPK
ncbi:MAG: VWA domain-containing protein [Acidobacteriia bacterium]|nr:VWA domain-containing protein [Terriglobia bacterium]